MIRSITLNILIFIYETHSRNNLVLKIKKNPSGKKVIVVLIDLSWLSVENQLHKYFNFLNVLVFCVDVMSQMLTDVDINFRYFKNVYNIKNN